MSKSATLKDVANAAGVSISTAARVIRKKGYVAAETRRRVEAAVEQTGYRVNVLARGLRKQRSYTIGHILKSTFPNPFYVQVSLGAEQCAREHDYSILVCNIQGDPKRERVGIETLMRRRVDAIIFTTPTEWANLQLALDDGIPIVQVERPLSADHNRVLVDNYTGAVAAMEHLIQLGHRRIGFIGQHPSFDANPNVRYVEEQRLGAYVDTLTAHGIPVDPNLITFGAHYHLDVQRYSGDGNRLAEQLIRVEPRPTAIFATSDLLAAGALQAIHAHALRVPDDISLIGFDDTFAPFLAPALTTVRLPMLELGRAAVRMLMPLLEDETSSSEGARTEILSTELIIRDSTALARSP